jgi:hypothetical protein
MSYAGREKEPDQTSVIFLFKPFKKSQIDPWGKISIYGPKLGRQLGWCPVCITGHQWGCHPSCTRGPLLATVYYRVPASLAPCSTYRVSASLAPCMRIRVPASLAPCMSTLIYHWKDYCDWSLKSLLWEVTCNWKDYPDMPLQMLCWCVTCHWKGYSDMSL